MPPRHHPRYHPRLLSLIAAMVIATPAPGADDPTRPPGQAPPLPAGTATQQTQVLPASLPPGSLYAKTPAELEHKDVLGLKGERLGRIAEVVSERHSGRIHVVIISGGFMGLPANEHVFALDALKMRDDSLRLPITEARLRARDTYRKEAYTRVEPKDRPISEFAAFEAPER